MKYVLYILLALSLAGGYYFFFTESGQKRQLIWRVQRKYKNQIGNGAVGPVNTSGESLTTLTVDQLKAMLA